MENDKFFLRDEKYSPQEMIDRIPSEVISSGSNGFSQSLSEHGLDPDEYVGLNKSDFLESITYKFDTESDKNDFIADLFSECGQKGDKFNVQIYNLPPNRCYDSIGEKARNFEKTKVSDRYNFVENVLYLEATDCSSVSSGNGDFTMDIADLSFRTTEEVEDIEPTEDLKIRVICTENGELEAEYGEGYKVEAPTQNRVEARIYQGKKTIAVTNSNNVTDSVQNDVVSVVTEWGEIDG